MFLHDYGTNLDKSNVLFKHLLAAEATKEDLILAKCFKRESKL
jgi:hypothetical protein